MVKVCGPGFMPDEPAYLLGNAGTWHYHTSCEGGLATPFSPLPVGDKKNWRHEHLPDRLLVAMWKIDVVVGVY